MQLKEIYAEAARGDVTEATTIEKLLDWKQPTKANGDPKPPIWNKDARTQAVTMLMHSVKETIEANGHDDPDTAFLHKATEAVLSTINDSCMAHLLHDEAAGKSVCREMDELTKPDLDLNRQLLTIINNHGAFTEGVVGNAVILLLEQMSESMDRDDDDDDDTPSKIRTLNELGFLGMADGQQSEEIVELASKLRDIATSNVYSVQAQGHALEVIQIFFNKCMADEPILVEEFDEPDGLHGNRPNSDAIVNSELWISSFSSKIVSTGVLGAQINLLAAMMNLTTERQIDAKVFHGWSKAAVELFYKINTDDFEVDGHVFLRKLNDAHPAPGVVTIPVTSCSDNQGELELFQPAGMVKAVFLNTTQGEIGLEMRYIVEDGSLGDLTIRQEDISEVIPADAGFKSIQIILIPSDDEDASTEFFLATDNEAAMQSAMHILWPSLAPSEPPGEWASELSQSSNKSVSSTGRSRVSVVATAIKLNPDKAVTPKPTASSSSSSSKKKVAAASGRYTPIKIVSTPTPNRSKKKPAAATPKSSSVSLSYGGHAEASNSDSDDGNYVSDNNADDIGAMQIETQAFDGANNTTEPMATVHESETFELKPVPESLDIPVDEDGAIPATKSRRNTSMAFELSSSEEEVSEYQPSQKLSAPKPKAKAKSRAKSRANASANVSDDTDSNSDSDEKMLDAGNRGSRSAAKSKAKAKAKPKARKPVVDDVGSGESDDEQSDGHMNDDDDEEDAAAAEAAEAADIMAKAGAAKRKKDSAAAKRKEAAAAKRKAAAAEKKAAADKAAEDKAAAAENKAAAKRAVAKKKAADAKLKAKEDADANLKAKEDAAAAAAAAVIVAARKAKAKAKTKAKPAARSTGGTSGKSKASAPRKRTAVVDDSDDSAGPAPYSRRIPLTPKPASRARSPTPTDSEIDQSELEDDVPYHRRTPARSKTAAKASRIPATPIPKSATEQPSRSRKAAGSAHPGDSIPSRKRPKVQPASSDESPVQATASPEQFGDDHGMDMFEQLVAQKTRASTAAPDTSIKEIMRDGGDSMVDEMMVLITSQAEERTGLDSRHDTDSAALNAKIAQVKASYDGFQARFGKLSESAEHSAAKIVEVDQSLLQLFKANAAVVDGIGDTGGIGNGDAMELDDVKGSIQAKVKKIVNQLHTTRPKKQNNQMLQTLLQCMQ